STRPAPCPARDLPPAAGPCCARAWQGRARAWHRAAAKACASAPCPWELIVLQRSQQEQPRFLPVAADAAFGTLEQRRDLQLRQPGEVAQLDDLRQARVDGGQPGQGRIQAQRFLVQAQAALDLLGQLGDAVQVAAALLRQA